jgi:hypothetical protein
MAKSQYTHDAVATIGEYTDRQTGETKKRYVNVGKAFTDDSGRVSIKLDVIPVGLTWSGWISLYPASQREQQRPAPASQQPPERQRHEAAKAASAASTGLDDEDEIPF